MFSKALYKIKVAKIYLICFDRARIGLKKLSHGSVDKTVVVDAQSTIFTFRNAAQEEDPARGRRCDQVWLVLVDL